MKSIKEICNEAADYIERNGWCQGGGGAHGSKRCLLGALNSVSFNNNCLEEYERAGDAIVQRLNVPNRYFIAVWNDTPGRTKQEVIDLLRSME